VLLFVWSLPFRLLRSLVFRILGGDAFVDTAFTIVVWLVGRFGRRLYINERQCA
jgi:hypothetical protein